VQSAAKKLKAGQSVAVPVVVAARQPPRRQKKIIPIDGVATAVSSAPRAAAKVAPFPTVPVSDAVDPRPVVASTITTKNPSSSPSATLAVSPSGSVDSQPFNVGGSVPFHDDQDPFGVSEPRPTTSPPKTSNAVLGAAAAKKMRAVSSRKDDKNVPLSHTKLSQMVTDANKVLPKHMQLKNLKQQTVQTMDAFLDDLQNARATASLTSLIASAQHRMTPAIHRQCCMRMLMLITTRSDLLELYKQSRGGVIPTPDRRRQRPICQFWSGHGAEPSVPRCHECCVQRRKHCGRFPLRLHPFLNTSFPQ
jgi:hypothetical protein